MKSQNQTNNQDQTGGVNRDFSQQMDTDMRNRMKGEHTLQVGHDGDSFRQSEQGNAQSDSGGQDQQVQQHQQFSSGRGHSRSMGGRNQPGS